jgi:peptide/nickel transport system substrate-binding protein
MHHEVDVRRVTPGRKARKKQGGNYVLKHRRLGVVLATAGVTWSIGMAGVAPRLAAAATPQQGGVVTIESTGATSLDPISPVWPTGSSYGYQIYGSLFDPTGTSGATLAPDLATGYKYSDNYKTLTVTLRQGVKFQDGTPFNAAAVKFNLERDAGNTSNVSQYFTDLSSVTTPSSDTVAIHLSQPNPSMALVLADTNAGFIVSPTAVKKEGAKFGLFPIGAGAFKVTSNNPNQLQVLSAWNGYYDQKHRYLKELKYLNTGNDANVTYNDLASGAIQSFTAIGVSDPPSVLSEAAQNKNISLVRGSDLVYTFLPINTHKAPFNNQLAREAIDYCTDRQQIAKDIQGGWAYPAPILAGASEQYYPGSGSEAAKRNTANSLLPYQYNLKKGTALVKKLGGLSFQFNILQGQTQVIATALAQQWAQCGIKATQNIVGFGQVFQDYATGNYQISTQISGGIFDPAIYVPLYSVPSAADDKFGFNSPKITQLLQNANTDSGDTTLNKVWSQIWGTEDQLAVNIPIVSGENLYFDNKCLQGLSFIEAGVAFRNAYYTCKP